MKGFFEILAVIKRTEFQFDLHLQPFSVQGTLGCLIDGCWNSWGLENSPKPNKREGWNKRGVGWKMTKHFVEKAIVFYQICTKGILLSP